MESVVFRGRRLWSPVLSCRPVRLGDYPEERLAVHIRIETRAGLKMQVDRGSVVVPCEDCGIELAVGPLQQDTRDLAVAVGLSPHVVCLPDGARRVSAAYGGNLSR